MKYLSVGLLLKPALPGLLQLQEVLGLMEGPHAWVAACQLLPVPTKGAAQLENAPAAHELCEAIVQCW